MESTVWYQIKEDGITGYSAAITVEGQTDYGLYVLMTGSVNVRTTFDVLTRTHCLRRGSEMPVPAAVQAEAAAEWRQRFPDRTSAPSTRGWVRQAHVIAWPGYNAVTGSPYRRDHT